MGKEKVRFLPIRIQLCKPFQKRFPAFGAVKACINNKGFAAILHHIAVEIPQRVIGQGDIYLKNTGFVINFCQHFVFSYRFYHAVFNRNMLDKSPSVHVGRRRGVCENSDGSSHVNIVGVVARLSVAVRLTRNVNIIYFRTAKQTLFRQFFRPQRTYKSAHACGVGRVCRFEVHDGIFFRVAGYRNIGNNTVRNQSERAAHEAFAFKVRIAIIKVFCVLRAIHEMRRAFTRRIGCGNVFDVNVVKRSKSEHVSD